jgi:hypothetical protein
VAAADEHVATGAEEEAEAEHRLHEFDSTDLVWMWRKVS